MKRLLSTGIILLFIGLSISSSTGFNTEQSGQPLSSGNTLNVGGNGPGNYTKIQDAIDDASDGDTVFVYNGIYYENLVVNVSINLIGEDRYSTIIRFTNYSRHMDLKADYITLNEFSIQFNDRYNSIWVYGDYNTISGNIFDGRKDRGLILLRCEFNVISNNTFYNFKNGAIELDKSNYSVIYNNSIIYDKLNSALTGIGLIYSNHNKVIGNYISGYYNGIGTFLTEYNNISRNTVINNNYGIQIYFSENVTVTLNNVSNNNHIGVFVDNCKYIKIINNNFFRNQKNSYFIGGIIYYYPKIKWNNNYWGEPRLIPYPITGFLCGGLFHAFFQLIVIDRTLCNWINFDWYPAQEPYDIEV